MKILKIKKLTEEDYERFPEEEKGEIVTHLIREKYSLSDEIAMLRQRDSKPEEFEEYNKFAEKCKKKADKILKKQDKPNKK